MIDYSYTETHNKEQWAWEFLRRNPEYQRDYGQFIHRWNILENIYGKDADRDHELWQNDLRSFANEWDNKMTLLEEYPDSERNNSVEDTVQIEAWMSSKWGFQSFPIDPVEYSPNAIAELVWSEQTINLDDIHFDAEINDPVVQVNFDLRCSLQEQLDAAHKELITLTGQMQRRGKLKLVAADHYQEWLDLIKLLDDTTLFEESSEEQQLVAKEMVTTGYRKILLMRG